jgi:hypothetical protein
MTASATRWLSTEWSPSKSNRARTTGKSGGCSAVGTKLADPKKVEA